MVKKFNFKKLINFILIGQIIFIPCLVFANIIYPPSPNWSKIFFMSLIYFLVMWFVWIFSPLGMIFIIFALIGFLVFHKTIRIFAWIFQGLVLFFTILIGIVGIVYSFSLHGEIKYIYLISIIKVLSVISFLIIGTLTAENLWHLKQIKPKE